MSSRPELAPAAGKDLNSIPRFDYTLGVATDVEHWVRPDGRLWAYEPYVREMNVWGALFAKVRVCAPRGEAPMRGTQAPYAVPNVEWQPLNYSQLEGTRGRISRAVRLPGLVRTLDRLVRTSDIVLLRSPGQTALVARLLAQARGVPTITKWAGFFGVLPGDRPLRRLEYTIAERIRRPVLIYGPSASPHLVSFIPALMSSREIQRAREASLKRSWEPPWRILAVGRLSPEKQFDLVIRGLAQLRDRYPQLQWTFTLAGDGNEAERLRSLVAQLRLDEWVTFAGALRFSAVQQLYANSHVVVMPGTHEGWPKVIPEAWAHGAVPIGAEAGIVPWMMEGTQAGLTFQPTPDELADTIGLLLSDPVLLQRMSARGYEQVAELTLEEFARRLETVLKLDCGLL
jgi:glycosyltransferase involved in cell wall biosynthesis